MPDAPTTRRLGTPFPPRPACGQSTADFVLHPRAVSRCDVVRASHVCENRLSRPGPHEDRPLPMEIERPLLSQPEFRALLGARLTSNLAGSALATVVAFQTYQITRDPLSLGWLGLVEAIPALSLVLFGGHVADRRDRRTIVLVDERDRDPLRGAFAVLSATGSLGLLGILAVIFVTGIASGFERPALSAFEAQVIPRSQAVRGVSFSSSVSQTGVDRRSGPRRHRDRGHRPAGDVRAHRRAAGDLDRLSRPHLGQADARADRGRAVQPEPARRDPLRRRLADAHRVDGPGHVRGLLRRGDRPPADLRERHPPRRAGRASACCGRRRRSGRCS